MSLTGRTILLADDEAYLREIVSYNLKKAGATVLTECNGVDLCAAAQAMHPELIVTDYQMPVLDGFRACVQLKENSATAGIPVIMLTARGHRLSPSDLARTSICCLIPKPFSAKQLLAQVEELLGANVAPPVPAQAPNLEP